MSDLNRPYTDIVDCLRERATFARGEDTGTGDADAAHFEQAASEIERLRAQLADAEKLQALGNQAELEAAYRGKAFRVL